ncbi:MAG: Asp23/Gls24 family envelope stress response protein [Clostridia bacterium]|nr:Asp23/Gls24 family envelope stress response protein [Clostridia bacterium]
MSMNGKNPRGSCVISEEVVTGIASEATLEIPGVAAMAPARPSEIRDFVTTPIGKTVRFTNEADATVIDVYVSLYDNVRIPDVAAAVQRSVKNAVQSMTGTPVSKVNVHVVDLKPAETEEK